MEQKAKLSILIILLIVIIFGSVYWILNKKDVPSITQTTRTALPSDQKLPDSTNVNTDTQTTRTALPSDQKLPDSTNVNTDPESIREISGKIRSIFEKVVNIELEDGKDFAAKINPNTTAVITQGANKPNTLADLKIDQNVTIKADSTDNAIQILIRE